MNTVKGNPVDFGQGEPAQAETTLYVIEDQVESRPFAVDVNDEQVSRPAAAADEPKPSTVGESAATLLRQSQLLVGRPRSHQRHIFYSLLAGLGLRYLVHLMPHTEQLTLTGDFVGFIFLSIIAYFPVSYFMYGHFPLVGRIGRLLGKEKGKRRRVILALLFTLPFLLVLPVAPLVFAVMYYLMGYAPNWVSTGNEWHELLDGLSGAAAEVRGDIIAVVKERQIPNLNVEEVEVHEKGADGFVDRHYSKQIEITQHRARLILRVQPYGDCLFVRLESYMDQSGRRLFLLWRLTYGVINSFVVRWVGTDLMELQAATAHILFGTTSRSNGGRANTLGPLDTIIWGSTEVPSYLLDQIYALEKLVTRATVTLLDQKYAQNLGEERIKMAVDRHVRPTAK